MNVFARSRGKPRPHKQLPPAQSFAAMSEWFRSPLGRTLLNTEKQCLKPLTSRLFGYHMLQMGCSNERSLLDDSPAALKINFVPEYKPGQLSAAASNEALPLGTESMDVVLIHHALDFTTDSHRLLREASRVTTPGGRLLVVGFNPLSSWGVTRLGRWRQPPPWNARFISALRVIDWLMLLDYRLEGVSHGGFMLPWSRSAGAHGQDRSEQIGQRFCAPLGCFYIIDARKQQVPITPVMSRWPRLRAPVIGGRLADTGRIAGSNYPVRSDRQAEDADS